MATNTTSQPTAAPAEEAGVSLKDLAIDLVQLVLLAAVWHFGWGEHVGLMIGAPGDFTPLGTSVVLVCVTGFLTTFESDKPWLRATELLLNMLYIVLAVGNLYPQLRMLLIAVLVFLNGAQLIWIPLYTFLSNAKTHH